MGMVDSVHWTEGGGWKVRHNREPFGATPGVSKHILVTYHYGFWIFLRGEFGNKNRVWNRVVPIWGCFFSQDDDRYVDGSDNSCLRKICTWGFLLIPFVPLDWNIVTCWLNFIRSMYGVNIPVPWSIYGPRDPMTILRMEPKVGWTSHSLSENMTIDAYWYVLPLLRINGWNFTPI